MPADPARVKDLFLAALDRRPADRDAVLAAEGDAGVRDEVRKLLAAHDGPGSYLNPTDPGLSTVPPPTDFARPDSAPAPPAFTVTVNEQATLAWRIRAVAILQVLNCLSFLPVIYSGKEEFFTPEALGRAGVALLWTYLFVNLAVAVGLGVRRDLSVRRLRQIDAAVLALVVVGLCVWQYNRLAHAVILPAEGPGHRSTRISFINFDSNILDLCSILIYGAAIPTPTRLQAWRLSSIVVAVLATVLVAAAQYPEVGERASLLIFSTISMLGSGAAVVFYTTYKVNTLAREVSAARKELHELGQYHVGERLGGGGMGEVYRAEHRLLKRPCAIKLIRPEMAADPSFVKRFDREVRAMTRLTHPASIQVFDYGRNADGVCFYAMEYVPGLTLNQLVQKFGPMPADRAVPILGQLCGALAEAHALGLVHRDIKPGNVMLCRRGGSPDRVKLLDFGLVTNLDSDDSRLTQAGGILGTPGYMSPEQAGGAEHLTAATDQYSLGAVAYYLLTGRPPFEAANTLQLLRAHLTEPVTPPTAHNPTIPLEIEAVVVRLLAKQPADRFASAADVEAALRRCPAARDWTDEQARSWWAEFDGMGG